MQQTIIDHLSKNQFISSSWCRKNNIPTVYLSRMVKSGLLEQVTKGLYIAANSGNYDDFYIFQYQYKKTIFSYETSLYLLGLTDKNISTFDVTVENHYKFATPPVNATVHYVNNNLFNLGITEVKTNFGNTVKTYSAERTVCDFIKDKDKCDYEIYIKLLKNFASMKNKNITLLEQYAKAMNITEKVLSALEVLI